MSDSTELLTLLFGFAVTMGLSVLFGWFVVPIAVNRRHPDRRMAFLMCILFIPFAWTGLLLRWMVREFFDSD